MPPLGVRDMDDIQSGFNRFESRWRFAQNAACALARRTRMPNDVRNPQARKATFLFDRDGPKPFQLFRILQA
jgi:hypothetical protein